MSRANQALAKKDSAGDWEFAIGGPWGRMRVIISSGVGRAAIVGGDGRRVGVVEVDESPEPIRDPAPAPDQDADGFGAGGYDCGCAGRAPKPTD